jgi:fumarate hydratase, class II
MAATRVESDSFGPIEVPAHALWGAQTQRSLHFFAIGEQRLPRPLVHALAQVKRAAALVNAELGLLEPAKAQAIAEAALQVAAGEHDAQFPLSMWQTGSGTQSHMNVNEVLANLASLALGGGLGAERSVHPHDDVNRGQSSNDVFPTVMHVAVALRMPALLAALQRLRLALQVHAQAWVDTLKVGRTHLQDATPVTLGQEFAAYDAQLALAETVVLQAQPALHALAIGGTAVGNGLNTHAAFGQRVVQVLAGQLGLPFTVATNRLAATAGHEALVALHSALRLLAVALTKLGNDLRLMGSGPRAGFGEINLPANEPGSSIMPGKVNPTQVEALLMVCQQVMGHDVAVGIAASQGQFELNTGKPLIAFNLLDSQRLLTDAIASLAAHCVEGLTANPEHLQHQLDRSLMLVTALSPHIGHERAARIAEHAQAHGLTLREAALAMGGRGLGPKDGGLSAAEFDAWVDARRMLGPG